MTNKKKLVLALSVATALCTGVAMTSAFTGDEVTNAAAATVSTFRMEDGASVRIKQGDNGLRFTATLSASEYYAIENATTSYGMLIAPKEYVDEVPFTLETVFGPYATYDWAEEVDGEWVYNGTKTRIINIEYDELRQDDDGRYAIRGSVTNLKDANVSREYVGLAYINQNGTYTLAEYTVGENERSMSEVACKAIADTSEDAPTDENKDLLKATYIDKVYPVACPFVEAYTCTNKVLSEDTTYNYVYTLNGSWASGGRALKALDLSPYTEVSFKIKANDGKWIELGTSAGLSAGATADNVWKEVRLTKEDSVWRLYFNGAWTAVTVTNLNEIYMQLGDDGTFDVTDLYAKYKVHTATWNPSYNATFEDVIYGSALDGALGASSAYQYTYSWAGTPQATFIDYDLSQVDKVTFYLKKTDSSDGWWQLFNGGVDTGIAGNTRDVWVKISVVKEDLGGGNYDYRIFHNDGWTAKTLANPNLNELGFILNGTYCISNLIIGEIRLPVVDTGFSDLGVAPLSGVESTANEKVTIDGVPVDVTAYSYATGSDKISLVDCDLTDYQEVYVYLNYTGWWFELYANTNTNIYSNKESNWNTVKFVRGDGNTWSAYINGTLKSGVSVEFNNLNALSLVNNQANQSFQVAVALKKVQEETPDVPEIPAEPEGVIKPVAMDPIWVNGAVAPEGYEATYQLHGGYITKNFVELDLSAYKQVSFQIKTDSVASNESGYWELFNQTASGASCAGNDTKWTDITIVKEDIGDGAYNYRVFKDGAWTQLCVSDGQLSNLIVRLNGTYSITNLNVVEEEKLEEPIEIVNVLTEEPIEVKTDAEALNGAIAATQLNVYTATWAAAPQFSFVDFDLSNTSNVTFYLKKTDADGNAWWQLFNGGVDAGISGNTSGAWEKISIVKEDPGDGTYNYRIFRNDAWTAQTLANPNLNELSLLLNGTYEISNLIIDKDTTLSLAQDNTSEYAIVYDAGNSQIAFAATELQTFFQEATGATLSMAEYPSDIQPSDKYIVLSTDAAEKLNYASLTDGEYGIATCYNSLYVYGENGYSVLGGVYALLEKLFGLTFYYYDEYTLNTQANVSLRTQEVGSRAFEYTLAGYGEMRPGMTAYSDQYLYRMGFAVDYLVNGMGAHNALSLIPYETYGSSHPEWFYEGTTLDGSNTGKQLVFASEATITKNGNAITGVTFNAGEGSLVRLIAEKLAEQVKNDSLNKYSVGITPMDIDIWCNTGNSATLYNRFGTYSAEYILFYNALAPVLEAELQERGVTRKLDLELLAYNKALCAPDLTNLTATEKNLLSLYDGNLVKVVPYFAPVESNYVMKWDDTRNVVKNPATGKVDANSPTVLKALQGWAALSDEVHVWTYSLDASSYFMLMNTTENMLYNYKLAIANGVTVMYNQSQYDTSVSTDWARLKLYLQKEIAKNPNMTDDDFNGKITAFMNNFYGAGGSSMLTLFNEQKAWYNNQIGNSYDASITTYCPYWLGSLRGSDWIIRSDKAADKLWDDEPTTFITTTYDNSMFVRWMGYINAAKTAVQNDATLTDAEKTEICARIDVESLTIRYLNLKVYSNSNYDANLTAFYKVAYALGVTCYKEGGAINADGTLK